MRVVETKCRAHNQIFSQIPKQAIRPCCSFQNLKNVRNFEVNRLVFPYSFSFFPLLQPVRLDSASFFASVSISIFVFVSHSYLLTLALLFYFFLRFYTQTIACSLLFYVHWTLLHEINKVLWLIYLQKSHAAHMRHLQSCFESKSSIGLIPRRNVRFAYKLGSKTAAHLLTSLMK